MLLFPKRGWLRCHNVLSPSVSASSILGPGYHFPYATTMMWEGELELPMHC